MYGQSHYCVLKKRGIVPLCMVMPPTGQTVVRLTCFTLLLIFRNCFILFCFSLCKYLQGSKSVWFQELISCLLHLFSPSPIGNLYFYGLSFHFSVPYIFEIPTCCLLPVSNIPSFYQAEAFLEHFYIIRCISLFALLLLDFESCQGCFPSSRL